MVLVKIAGSNVAVEANEICNMCGEPVHIPAEAVRCEWGCCYIDVSEKQLKPETRERGGRPWHECSACSHETHRFNEIQLLERLRNGDTWIAPRPKPIYANKKS